MTRSKMTKSAGRARALGLVGLISALGSTGCASDGGSDGDRNPGRTAESWIVGGWLFQDPAYFGYLALVDDLSQGGAIDLGSVREFEGDFVYTVHEGAVFVGQEDRPTIEKWIVNDRQQLEKIGEISFQAFGVTTTLGGGRNVIQILDGETGWYFDSENYQVIVFDPATMTTEGVTIDYDGMQEDGHDVAMGFVSRVGDYFVTSARYWELPDEYAAPLTRAAFIHAMDHSVVYADDRRCGGIGFQATDADGNLYFGPHHGLSTFAAAGLEPNTGPCLLRVRAGETGFDADYYVDLAKELDEVVAGLVQGDDGHAYLYRYAGEPITPETAAKARFAEAWELYGIELRDPAGTFAKVQDYAASPPLGGSFRVQVGSRDERFVIAPGADYLSGKYYQLTGPTTAAERLSFPGFPGSAHNY